MWNALKNRRQLNNCWNKLFINFQCHNYPTCIIAQKSHPIKASGIINSLFWQGFLLLIKKKKFLCQHYAQQSRQVQCCCPVRHTWQLQEGQLVQFLVLESTKVILHLKPIKTAVKVGLLGLIEKKRPIILKKLLHQKPQVILWLIYKFTSGVFNCQIWIITKSPFISFGLIQSTSPAKKEDVMSTIAW